MGSELPMSGSPPLNPGLPSSLDKLSHQFFHGKNLHIGFEI